jgi:hypothetical protein
VDRGSGVTVDGAATVTTGSLRANALAPCPGNVCSGWMANAAGQIAYGQFVARAGGLQGWQAVSAWAADPADPINQICEAFKVAAKIRKHHD